MSMQPFYHADLANFFVRRLVGTLGMRMIAQGRQLVQQAGVCDAGAEMIMDVPAAVPPTWGTQSMHLNMAVHSALLELLPCRHCYL